MHISLDENTEEIITKLAKLSGLSVGCLVDKLLAPQLPALYEIEELLASLQPNTKQHDAVLNLLQSYGHDETLMQGVERLAPAGYKTLAQRFHEQLEGVIMKEENALQAC